MGKKKWFVKVLKRPVQTADFHGSIRDLQIPLRELLGPETHSAGVASSHDPYQCILGLTVNHVVLDMGHAWSRGTMSGVEMNMTLYSIVIRALYHENQTSI